MVSMASNNDGISARISSTKSLGVFFALLHGIVFHEGSARNDFFLAFKDVMIFKKGSTI